MSNYQKLNGQQRIILQEQDHYDESYEQLKPGVYRLRALRSMMGTIPAFDPIEEKDSLIAFKSGIIADVLGKADSFYSEQTKQVYKELKAFHKTGIIMHGRPGTGKTCTALLIMNEIAKKHSAIRLDATRMDLDDAIFCIRQIRTYQNNPVVLFMDEFEYTARGEEEELLTFLDGTDSIEGLFFIGCTNYIDKIPDRIKNRKSRIKYQYQIDSLPHNVYYEYAVDRIGFVDVAQEFATQAVKHKVTLDQLKHALLDYRLEGLSIEHSVMNAADIKIPSDNSDSDSDED